jgi:uncharacterized protein
MARFGKLMTTLLYDASVPVFLRYLERLECFVDAAEAFARASARDRQASIDELLAARLEPDMLPFEQQVLIATNFSLRACFPLADEPIPPDGEFPATAAGLRARAHRAAALLRSLPPARFDDAQARVLESRAGLALVRLPAAQFLFEYALPNFFFHVTAAYAILRSQGVPLGKEDFDGFHAYRRNPKQP